MTVSAPPLPLTDVITVGPAFGQARLLRMPSIHTMADIKMPAITQSIDVTELDNLLKKRKSRKTADGSKMPIIADRGTKGLNGSRLQHHRDSPKHHTSRPSPTHNSPGRRVSKMPPLATTGGQNQGRRMEVETGTADGEHEVQLPPDKTLPPLKKSVTHELVWMLTARVFGSGGDIRASSDGHLIYTVQKRRTAQISSLFLQNAKGKSVAKIAQRPGSCGMNFDLYVRGRTVACGAAGWVLCGMVDRASFNDWAPRLTLRWKDSVMILIGDFFGQSFRFQESVSSKTVGTFILETLSPSFAPYASSAPSTPSSWIREHRTARKSLRTAPALRSAASEPALKHAPTSPSFPERWQLSINTDYILGHSNSVSRAKTARRRSSPSSTQPSGGLPVEMFLTAALVVEHFMKEERENVVRRYSKKGRS